LPKNVMHDLGQPKPWLATSHCVKVKVSHPARLQFIIFGIVEPCFSNGFWCLWKSELRKLYGLQAYG